MFANDVEHFGRAGAERLRRGHDGCAEGGVVAGGLAELDSLAEEGCELAFLHDETREEGVAAVALPEGGVGGRVGVIGVGKRGVGEDVRAVHGFGDEEPLLVEERSASTRLTHGDVIGQFRARALAAARSSCTGLMYAPRACAGEREGARGDELKTARSRTGVVGSDMFSRTDDDARGRARALRGGGKNNNDHVLAVP